MDSYSMIHNKNNRISFGEFDFDENPLLDRIMVNETSFGEVQLKGPVKIYMYPNERADYPHFHLVGKGDEKENMDVCFNLNNCNYFDHGNHNKHLNNRQLKQLNKYLAKPYTIKNRKFKSVWHAMYWWWNNTYYGLDVSNEELNNLSQPDYTRAKSYTAILS